MTSGPLGIAIPAELAGYHEAYTKFGGKLTWAQIVEPTIQICQDGVPIIQYVDNILKNKEKRIRSSETLRLVSQCAVCSTEVMTTAPTPSVPCSLPTQRAKPPL